MLNFKDGKLSEEEKKLFVSKVHVGKEDGVINKMDKSELNILKEKIIDKELDLNELDNVKAGIPQEMVEEIHEKNSNLFRK